MRRRGGTNGGGTHCSARRGLRAATGRGESILFHIFPSCAYFLNKGFVITFICSTVSKDSLSEHNSTLSLCLGRGLSRTARIPAKRLLQHLPLPKLNVPYACLTRTSQSNAKRLILNIFQQTLSTILLQRSFKQTSEQQCLL